MGDFVESGGGGAAWARAITTRVPLNDLR